MALPIVVVEQDVILGKYVWEHRVPRSGEHRKTVEQADDLLLPVAVVLPVDLAPGFGFDSAGSVRKDLLSWHYVSPRCSAVALLRT